MNNNRPTSANKSGFTLDEFEVIQMIGSGSYGKVYKIVRKVDRQVMVWKVLHYGSMSDKERELLVSEVNIIKDLSHPYIVRYLDRIIDRAKKNIHIIMEYCPSGDLSNFIKMMKNEGNSIDEETIWRIFTQLTMALKACHCRGSNEFYSPKNPSSNPQQAKEIVKLPKVIHRDIKPGNIMLDSEYNIKLGDFGLARTLSDSKQYAHTHVGTPYYMSPEQITDCGYDEKSDIWSLGCVLYELCNLHPPFMASNHLALAMKIKQGVYPAVNPKYSSSLSELIGKMLTVDPTKRINIERICEMPEIATRITEMKWKERYKLVKKREEDVRRREEALRRKEEDLRKREEQLERSIKAFELQRNK